MLAEFDAARRPVHVVACDTYREPGVDLGVTARPFAMVIDVRKEDAGFATELGYKPLPAQAVANFSLVNEGKCSPGAASITTEQRIHGLARRNFRTLFSGPTTSGVYDQYRYRYYGGTQNYLVLIGDRVHVHNGRDWVFQPVGKVLDFIPYIEGIPESQFPTPTPAGATRVLRLATVSYSAGAGEDSVQSGSYEWAENIVAQFDAFRLPIRIVACDNYTDGFGTPANVTLMAMVLDVRHEDLGFARSLGFVPMTAHTPVTLTGNRGACSFEDAPTITPARRIFGLSRRLFGATFIGEAAWNVEQPFTYQYYATSKNYLAVAGDTVYVREKDALDFQPVGSIKDFIPYIDGIPAASTRPAQ